MVDPNLVMMFHLFPKVTSFSINTWDTIIIKIVEVHKLVLLQPVEKKYECFPILHLIWLQIYISPILAGCDGVDDISLGVLKWAVGGAFVKGKKD